MNKSNRKIMGWWDMGGILPALVISALSLGCSAQREGTSLPRPANAEQSGRQLLNEVIAAYAAATTYRDDAKLIVRYQLNGRPMEEHQLWAIDFERPHRLAARLYNARIQSDERQATVMVFDFDSENMDNQYLVQPAENGIPWEKLFADPVCRHFISGSTEIPFNSELNDQFLMPPSIGMLLGKPDVSWLDDPEAVERLDDAEFQGEAFQRLKLSAERRTYELWIEPQTKIVRQVILPNQLLDAALLATPEITGLRLSVQFDNATFSPQWSTSPFSTDVPDTANPVTQFVPLPEPFPSEWIGKKIPAIALTDAQGTPRPWTPSNRPAIVAWVDRQDDSIAMIRLLESLTKLPSGSLADVQLCYAELPNPNLQAPQHSDLSQFTHEMATSLPIASDVGMAEGQKLGVKFAPTALIVNASGQAQYLVSPNKSDWRQRLDAAVKRMAAGEDLAAEMRSEYNQYLDSYKTKLQQLNPFGTDEHLAGHPATHQRDALSLELRKPEWTSRELKSPGSILTLDKDRVWINEGWQSVAELRLSSRRFSVRPLPVEADVSVTTLRSNPGGPSPVIVGFGEQGLQIVVIDAQGSLLGKTPILADNRICDAQLSPRPSGDSSRIWYLDSTSTIHEIDQSATATGRKLFVEAAESFIVLPPQADENDHVQKLLVVRSDGGLTLAASDGTIQPSFTFGALKVERLCAAVSLGEAHQSENPDGLIACATALDDLGNWVALGIDRQFEVVWKQSIGSQEFDRSIQPIAMGTDTAGRRHWAVVSADNTIAIFDDDGNSVDAFRWPEEIHGMCFVVWDGMPALLITDSAAISICAFKTHSLPVGAE